ncbi:MAG: dTDP-4-dehydrorhamnose reductase [Acidobacteriales bacterium]|nr:dTDP-4-dehydrorhamnose reductase [Terriglobales bacterium]
MDNDPQIHPLPELWAGVEATISRIGDRYSQQLLRSGHLDRLSDFEMFAHLGIKRLRFPVLWEQVAPSPYEQADWSWTDEALSEARAQGIEPIIGLLHHGSGPKYTNLLDLKFPELLAEYAGQVAKRYPWADAYTPVNEPLTTARFSALYGHWYPHERDDRSFVRALLNQCRGTVLAMQAIRRVNEKAKLIQTDDLGKIFSTPKLAYQAEFENERRWLTWDLLCGRVDRDHFLFKYLLKFGVSKSELEWFRNNPCSPDVIGVNHYLSSNRYLDDDIARYPKSAHGANGKDQFADVLAARVLPEDVGSPELLLRETWERYRITIAITEVHNGCTREEQARWYKYMWEAAVSAKRNGADIRAFTAWALLGSFDWNTLLTQEENFYEPGVFDVRGDSPRPTALATLVRELSDGRKPSHPVLKSKGWWQRDDRFHFGHTGNGLATHIDTEHDVRPILVTGATGTLGRAFARLCVIRGLPHRLLRRQEMDIADAESVRSAVEKHHPWAIINTAGYVLVDEAELEPERCFRENTTGPEILSQVCAERDVKLLTFSSDLVFDGNKMEPYCESDSVSPINDYGRSKAAAELAVLKKLHSALVIRSSAFFGPWDEYNFVTLVLRRLREGLEFVAAEDVAVSPTYLPDLVHNALDLLIDDESGIWHLANQGAIAWAELARKTARIAGLDPGLVKGVPLEMLELAAPRPRYSVLGSERGQLMPTLENALDRYFKECEVVPLQSMATR